MAKLILALMIAVAAADECTNSDTWYAKKERKNCHWVAKKPSRCKYKRKDAEGMSAMEACPEACGTCGCAETGTSDSETWYRKKPNRDCNWVAKKKASRCKAKTKDASGVLSANACPIACGMCDGPTSAGSCYFSSQGHAIKCDYTEADCGAEGGIYYGPGFMSNYGEQCCHCKASCDHSAEGSATCGETEHDYRDSFKCDGDGDGFGDGTCCEATSYQTCEAVSAGSCYFSSQGHAVKCDYTEADCDAEDGAYYGPGFTSSMGNGCCHCGAGCDHTAEGSETCADGASYYDSVASASCEATSYNNNCQIST
jgi:hypothetical protein